MRCDMTAELIGAYLDQELDVDTRREVAAHLGSCAACSALAQDLRGMGRQLSAIGRELAPKHLAVAVQERLAVASAGKSSVLSLSPFASIRAAAWWRQAAAALVLVCLTAAATAFVMSRNAAMARTEQEVAAAHVRSLLQDSPTQVASSEIHTVKPWFTGRLEFSPEVKDLAAKGFPLAGARLDYIGERRVAALVYRRRMHVVSVFLWPAPDGSESPPRALIHQGYNILAWRKGGMAYWAISDLNLSELLELQGQL
jgi:anti-sigma factor RsiW